MTDIVETYWPNGRLKERYETKNGKKHGTYLCFYETPSKQTCPNGHLRLRCNYVQGTKNGQCCEYHTNGQLESLHTYINGNLSGHYRSWHDNGQRCREWHASYCGTYGLVRRWNRDGKKIEEKETYDDCNHGVYIEWDDDGTPHVEYHDQDYRVDFRDAVQRQCRWMKKELMEYVHHPDRQMRIAKAYGLSLDEYHDILD